MSEEQNFEQVLKNLNCEVEGHKNKSIEFVCLQSDCHKRLLCSSCLIEDHKQHIEKIELLEQFLLQQPNEKEAYPKNLLDLQQKINQITTQKNQFEPEIDDQKQCIAKTLQEYEQKIQKQTQEKIKILESKLEKSKEHINQRFDELEQINQALNKQNDDEDNEENQQEEEEQILQQQSQQYEQQQLQQQQEEQDYQKLSNGQTMTNKGKNKNFQYQEIDSYEKLESFVTKLINSSTDRKPIANSLVDILPYYELQILQNMEVIDQKIQNPVAKKLIYFKDYEGFIQQNQRNNNISQQQQSVERIEFKKKILTGCKLGVNLIQIMESESKLVVALNDGTLQIFDIKSGQPIKKITGNFEKMSLMKIIGGQWLLMLYSDNQKIHLINLNDYQITKQFVGHQKQITCAAEYFDNKIVTGSLDKQIKIWDFDQQKCIRTMNFQHQDIIKSVKVLSRDEIITTSGNDINLIDLQMNIIVNKLTGHKEQVTQLHLMKNKFQLLSISNDQVMKLWNLTTIECCFTVQLIKNPIIKLVQCNESTLYILNKSGQLLQIQIDEQNQYKEVSCQQLEISNPSDLLISQKYNIIECGQNEAINIYELK